MPSLDTMMSYHRLKKAPLDDSEVFSSVSDLMGYCNSGACYNGQRVAVNENNKVFKYIIKNNDDKYIPIIDMKGSEPIFILHKFKDDSEETHGLLVYENNGNSIWNENDIFIFDEDRLCLFSQLDVFKINGIGVKIHAERIYRDDSSHGTANIVLTDYSIGNIKEKTGMSIMPTEAEPDTIIKIYIKAEDYYNALNS